MPKGMTADIKHDILPYKEGSKMNERFRELRAKTGLNQKQFAAAVGMPQSYIGRIEAGTVDINNISLRKAFIFATAIGCRMEDFVDDPRGIAREKYTEENRYMYSERDPVKKKLMDDVIGRFINRAG